MKIKRKSLQMSMELCTWYEEKAKEMGISASSYMVMALQQYVDQKKALEMMPGLPDLVRKMEEIKDQVKK